MAERDGLAVAAETRPVLGKQVKQLRRQGITPAHLYGPGVPSQALQAPTPLLEGLLARAGGTRLVQVAVDGGKPVSALVREVQRDALSGVLLHVDFYQVAMAEELTLEVPVALVGESAAVKYQKMVLDQVKHALPIRCLPADIPERLEVDISRLTQEAPSLLVRDIPLPPGVTVLADAEQVVARVEMPRAEEVVAVPAAAVPAEEVAEEKPAEEAAPAEGKPGPGKAPAEGRAGPGKAPAEKAPEK